MPDFSQRSNEIEIMDDLTYAGPLMNQTLAELEVINKWLGGNAVTLGGLKELLKGRRADNSPLRIADLGCGRGDILKIVDRWVRKEKRSAKLLGIDANPYIITVAQEHLRNFPHIELQATDIFSEDFRRQKFDIVMGTLFYHHFSEVQLTSFFRQLKDQVAIGFVVNDIHRHPLAFHSIKLLTRLFSKSSMVQYDAPLSVLRAFTKVELENILVRAGIVHYVIKWKWAFRWQVVVFSSDPVATLNQASGAGSDWHNFS